MAQLWEQEINGMIHVHQDEVLLGEYVDPAARPLDFGMDWEGTSFLMNMFSSTM
jgi:hypothetical protein